MSQRQLSVFFSSTENVEIVVQAYVKVQAFTAGLCGAKSVDIDFSKFTAEEIRLAAWNALVTRMTSRSDRDPESVEGTQENIASEASEVSKSLTVVTLLELLKPYIVHEDPQWRRQSMLLLGQILTRCPNLYLSKETMRALVEITAQRLFDWYAVEGGALVYLGLVEHHLPQIQDVIVFLPALDDEAEGLETAVPENVSSPSEPEILNALLMEPTPGVTGASCEDAASGTGAPSCLTPTLHQQGCIRAMLESLFKHVHTPGFSQPIRHSVLKFLNLILNQCPEIAGELGARLVTGVFCQLENEKDPRNLMLSFPLMRRVLSIVGDMLTTDSESTQQHLDLIADVMLSYFPIRFVAPPNDPYRVSGADLKRELASCMVCHSVLLSRVFDVLLDVLSDGLSGCRDDDVLEAIEALTLCADTYRSSASLFRDQIEPYFEVIKLAAWSTPCPYTKPLASGLATLMRLAPEASGTRQVVAQCTEGLLSLPSIPLATTSAQTTAKAILVEAAHAKDARLFMEVWNAFVPVNKGSPHLLQMLRRAFLGKPVPEIASTETETASTTRLGNEDVDEPGSGTQTQHARLNKLSPPAGSPPVMSQSSTMQSFSVQSSSDICKKDKAWLYVRPNIELLQELLCEAQAAGYVALLHHGSLQALYYAVVEFFDDYTSVMVADPTAAAIGVPLFDVLSTLALVLGVSSMETQSVVEATFLTFCRVLGLIDHADNQSGLNSDLEVRSDTTGGCWETAWSILVSQAMRLEPDVALCSPTSLVQGLFRSMSALAHLLPTYSFELLHMRALCCFTSQVNADVLDVAELLRADLLGKLVCIWVGEEATEKEKEKEDREKKNIFLKAVFDVVIRALQDNSSPGSFEGLRQFRVGFFLNLPMNAAETVVVRHCHASTCHSLSGWTAVSRQFLERFLLANNGLLYKAVGQHMLLDNNTKKTTPVIAVGSNGVSVPNTLQLSPSELRERCGRLVSACGYLTSDGALLLECVQALTRGTSHSSKNEASSSERDFLGYLLLPFLLPPVLQYPHFTDGQKTVSRFILNALVDSCYATAYRRLTLHRIRMPAVLITAVRKTLAVLVEWAPNTVLVSKALCAVSNDNPEAFNFDEKHLTGNNRTAWLFDKALTDGWVIRGTLAREARRGMDTAKETTVPSSGHPALVLKNLVFWACAPSEHQNDDSSFQRLLAAAVTIRVALTTETAHENAYIERSMHSSHTGSKAEDRAVLVSHGKRILRHPLICEALQHVLDARHNISQEIHQKGGFERRSGCFAILSAFLNTLSFQELFDLFTDVSIKYSEKQEAFPFNIHALVQMLSDGLVCTPLTLPLEVYSACASGASEFQTQLDSLNGWFILNIRFALRSSFFPISSLRTQGQDGKAFSAPLSTSSPTPSPLTTTTNETFQEWKEKVFLEEPKRAIQSCLGHCLHNSIPAFRMASIDCLMLLGNLARQHPTIALQRSMVLRGMIAAKSDTRKPVRHCAALCTNVWEPLNTL